MLRKKLEKDLKRSTRFQRTLRNSELYLSRRPRARGFLLFFSIIALIGGAVTFLFSGTVSGLSLLSAQTSVKSLAAATAFVGFLTLSVVLKAYELADREELYAVQRQSERLQERITKQEQMDVFDVIQLSLSQVTEYYTINKSQARKSFNFSVFAVFLGLATVIGGVWLMYYKRLGSVGTISAVSGLLLQFLGGANFYIYNKSLVQMNYFYDHLMRIQDTMLSINVGEQIQSVESRDKIKAQIVAGLLANVQRKAPNITSSQKRAKNANPEPKSRSAKAGAAD